MYFFFAAGAGWARSSGRRTPGWARSGLAILPVLTSVDEAVCAGEERGRHEWLVREEGERDGAVQRHAAARRDGPAVAPAERRVDQLARLQGGHLRVDVHVLVHASKEMTKVSVQNGANRTVNWIKSEVKIYLSWWIQAYDTKLIHVQTFKFYEYKYPSSFKSSRQRLQQNLLVDYRFQCLWVSLLWQTFGLLSWKYT